MSSSNVKINDMSSAIRNILEEFGDKATDAVRESAQLVGKNTAKELRHNSPKKTGKYAKGWKTKYAKTVDGGSAVVYNQDRYQLTHLLENGHMNRDGGKTEGIEHIGPANEKAQQEFLAEIEKRIR